MGKNKRSRDKKRRLSRRKHLQQNSAKVSPTEVLPTGVILTVNRRRRITVSLTPDDHEAMMDFDRETREADRKLRKSEGEKTLVDAAGGATDGSHPGTIDDRPSFFQTTFVSNKIGTSKYTLLTFLPKNLFEQFRRVANIYFIFLVVLQMVPYFSASSSIGISIMPIATIVCVTGAKDAFEDWKRHKGDNAVNRSTVRKVRNSGECSSTTTKTTTDPHAGHDNGSSTSKKQHDDDHAKTADEDLRRDARCPETTMVLWQTLQVGDLVILRSDEAIPADVVVLKTSEAEDGCFVETKNLDGETNLKSRKGVGVGFSSQSSSSTSASVSASPSKSPSTAAYDIPSTSTSSSKGLTPPKFWIDSEAPNPNLYTYTGVLLHLPPRSSSSLTDATMSEKTAAGENPVAKAYPLSPTNILLRGCVLRNTGWALGVVVYTGSDTKIMLNGGPTKSKQSRIERAVNGMVIMNFVILAILCAVVAIAAGLYASQTNASEYEFITRFLPADDWGVDSAVNGVLTFWVALIMFQNIVPISLYLSVEFSKSVQAYFIYSDIEMYYAPLDRPCVPRTWNISDDLGQIEYVFSDKTGTLTQNVMEFRRCTIGGKMYGTSLDRSTASGLPFADAAMTEHLSRFREEDVDRGKGNADDDVDEGERKQLRAPATLNPNPGGGEEHGTIRRRETREEKRRAAAIKDFWICLSVCHAVVVVSASSDPNTTTTTTAIATPENPSATSTSSNRLKYNAQSPDEAALVSTARDQGFVFKSRREDEITIEVLGRTRTYKVLASLEFTSARKRMSVIVRVPEEEGGGLILFCKGADSTIVERLAQNVGSWQKKLRAETAKHLEVFANEGLRTLCLAYRKLSQAEYDAFRRGYDEASTSLKDREDKVERCCDAIERNLVLMGGTAIEDKLQDGVPKTIATLARAGIKLWVLTGDKAETAINIGFSCNLLRKDMELIVVTGGGGGGSSSSGKEDAVEIQLRSALARYFGLTAKDDIQPSHEPPKTGTGRTHALIIDGDALKHALEPSLQPLLLALGSRCNSVICCRVSPLQKARVVRMVKTGMGIVSLAIGDGANDVSMIQEADVGVGIAGEEGLQAVMASDYAIAQFKFLERLLLVHGRWSYLRISEMILNFFYKNVVWTFALFWWQFFSCFSATILYDYTYVMLFNMVFTLLPVLVLGICDQDIDAAASLAIPELYRFGIRGKQFTFNRFWLYLLDATYQSLCCFLVPYGSWVTGGTQAAGYNADSLDSLGTIVAANVVTVTNIYVGLNQKSWTWMTFFVVGLSLASFYAYVAFYSQFSSLSGPSYRTDQTLFGDVEFWFNVFLTNIICLLPRFTLKYLYHQVNPSDADLIREQLYVKASLI